MTEAVNVSVVAVVVVVVVCCDHVIPVTLLHSDWFSLGRMTSRCKQYSKVLYVLFSGD